MSHPIPDDVAEALEDLNASQLRRVAEVASDLADEAEKQDDNSNKKSKAEIKHDVDADDFDRKDAPVGATLVTKNIDDRDYYYWNWRADGTVKSEYICPVNPKR